MKQSLTYDRGMEMFDAQAFTEHTKMQVYFADPYSPYREERMKTLTDYFGHIFQKELIFL